MTQLSKNARLFARNDDGNLARIGPGHGRALLESGGSIELVTDLAPTKTARGNSSSYSRTEGKFFRSDDRYQTSKSESKRTTLANYTAYPISDWESLLWEDDADTKGVPGAPVLPASGQPVVVSSSWEKKWNTYSEKNVGFFTVDTTRNASSGYLRETQEAL